MDRNLRVLNKLDNVISCAAKKLIKYLQIESLQLQKI